MNFSFCLFLFFFFPEKSLEQSGMSVQITAPEHFWKILTQKEKKKKKKLKK